MPVPHLVAWMDEIPPEHAVGICGAKMGRLAELLGAGVSLPKGFTVTIEAFRRHWDQAGLDGVAGAAQHFGQGLSKLRFVLRNQDVRHALARTAGSSTTKHVPGVGGSSSRISPPWSVTMRRTIARPRPIPPVLRLVE